MSSKKITSLILEELKKDKIINKNQKPVKICHATANKYLNEVYGRPS